MFKVTLLKRFGQDDKNDALDKLVFFADTYLSKSSLWCDLMLWDLHMHNRYLVDKTSTYVNKINKSTCVLIMLSFF